MVFKHLNIFCFPLKRIPQTWPTNPILLPIFFSKKIYMPPKCPSLSLSPQVGFRWTRFSSHHHLIFIGPYPLSLVRVTTTLYTHNTSKHSTSPIYSLVASNQIKSNPITLRVPFLHSVRERSPLFFQTHSLTLLHFHAVLCPLHSLSL